MNKKKTSGRRNPGAKSAGEQYANDQINGEYFMNWVFDQLVEASKMDPSKVHPINTLDDAKKIARKMLQQLEWDTRRALEPIEIERLIGGNLTRDRIEEFYSGFKRASDASRDWLAEEILRMHRSLRGGSSLDEAERSVDRTAWYIDAYRGEEIIHTSGPYASKSEAVQAMRRRRDLSWGDPYQGMDMGHAPAPEPSGLRANDRRPWMPPGVERKIDCADAKAMVSFLPYSDSPYADPRARSGSTELCFATVEGARRFFRQATESGGVERAQLFEANKKYPLGRKLIDDFDADATQMRERRSHRVSDFNTFEDLLEHARKEGATHVLITGTGSQTDSWIYFPSGDRIRPYAEAHVYHEHGYWHTEAPGERGMIVEPPRGARPIAERRAPQRGMREAPRGRRDAGGRQATKPGNHGTLKLWTLTYTDGNNPAFGESSIRTWAYDREAAALAFNEQTEADGESWEIVKIEPVLDTGPKRLSRETGASRRSGA